MRILTPLLHVQCFVCSVACAVLRVQCCMRSVACAVLHVQCCVRIVACAVLHMQVSAVVRRLVGSVVQSCFSDRRAYLAYGYLFFIHQHRLEVMVAVVDKYKGET